jgi:hypothetical protein
VPVHHPRLAAFKGGKMSKISEQVKPQTLNLERYKNWPKRGINPQPTTTEPEQIVHEGMSDEEAEAITKEEQEEWSKKTPMERWSPSGIPEISLEELKNRTKSLLEEFIDQHRPESSERGKAAKTAKASLQSLQTYLDKTYARELSIKKDYEIPTWSMQASIEKALKGTRFWDVWNYIQSHTLPINIGRILAESKYVKKKKIDINGEQKEFVLFVPDYEDMKRVLQLAKQSIGNYLRDFMDMDFLRKLGKNGEKGNLIFAAGYWSTFKNPETGKFEPRRVWFLKETPEIKAALRRFRVGKYEKAGL